MIDDRVHGGHLRWTEKIALLLLAFLVLLWVGAKIHFYTRFGSTTLDAYLREHWPFWAGMGLLALLLVILARVAATRTRP